MKELADMVSPNQHIVDEGPFDLVGIFADTCKAKKALNREAQFSTKEEMPKLLQSSKNQSTVRKADSNSVAACNKAAGRKKLSVFGR